MMSGRIANILIHLTSALAVPSSNDHPFLRSPHFPKKESFILNMMVSVVFVADDRIYLHNKIIVN
jgi:hypothetical protein